MSREEDNEFFDVFNDEMKKWIAPRRKQEDAPSKDEEKYFPKVDNRLIGLALSGGGIRSATHALGVLQRMARAGVLKFVDILSTASGGGYLGASWSSLTAGEPHFGSTEANFPFKFIDNEGEGERQLFDRESDAVRHLRAHGHWLAPHLGLFDVWTWVALFRYVFSTGINLLLIPIPWVLGLMMLTLMIPGELWNRREPLDSWILNYMWIGPAVLFFIFLLFVWWPHKPIDEGAETKHRLYRWQKIVLVMAVVWVLVDLFVLGIAGAYRLQITAEAWVATVGGSGAALLTAGRIIYNFFMEGKQGGVAAETGGNIKKVMSLLVGFLGYIALAILLLASYYAIDRYFFPDRSIQGFFPNNLSLYIILTAGAFTVAIGMLFMPVKFLNELSLQALYRRGMRKAYILQSNHPEEGVVPREKGFCLINLKEAGENPPDMPYHLIVTAVNTSGDTNLKRLGRRSDGFVFAHIHSGSRITGYRKTSEAYGNISLSEAMAISGAAVSPNMGRVTTTSNAILMTLLNVRIGSWIRNPKDIPEEPKPLRPLVWYWLKELFGIASAEDKYIYLSDGGHFDNSAIYELLKRRCKYILAIDAGSNFDNFATVSRLARIDLGVQMEVNLDHFKPDPETGLSQQSYVVAKLKYPPIKGDRKTEGILVWLSTTMTRKQKPDIIKYKETNPDFPFHSTGDQFFDQSQFEAYRQLGYTAAGTIIADADLEKRELTRRRLEDAFDKLWDKAASRQ